MTITRGTSLPPENTAQLPHFVSDAEFDLQSVNRLTPEQEKIYFASQLTLMWWKFRRHRVAVGLHAAPLGGSATARRPRLAPSREVPAVRPPTRAKQADRDQSRAKLWNNHERDLIKLTAIWRDGLEATSAPLPHLIR